MKERSKEMNNILETENYEVNYEIPVKGKSYDHLPTKSSKIREMYKDGISKVEISKRLNIRYQHVRNVLITPLSSK